MLDLKVVNKLPSISKIHAYKPGNNLLWNDFNLFIPVANTPPLESLNKIDHEALAIMKKVDQDLFGSTFKWFNMY